MYSIVLSCLRREVTCFLKVERVVKHLSVPLIWVFGLLCLLLNTDFPLTIASL